MRTYKVTCVVRNNLLDEIHTKPGHTYIATFNESLDVYLKYYELPIKYYSIGIIESHIYNDKHILNISSTTLEGKYTFRYQNTVVIVTLVRS